MKHDKKFYLIRSLAAGALIFICVMLLLASLISTRAHNQLQARNLQSLKATSDMAEYVRYSIQMRLMILKGYEVYVMTNPDISEEITMKYLKNLIGDDPLVKNVGIIKDTTIIFNYPKEENIKAIGVDISKIPDQRDALLKVKATGLPVFFGPVNLVQGGQGFIARIPINVGVDYWGQISLVLKADEVEAMFMNYAESRNLEIAMFRNDTDPSSLVLGNADILDKTPVLNSVTIMDSAYIIACVDNTPIPEQQYVIPSYIGAFLLSLLLAWLVFFSLMKSAEIKFQASIDSLTKAHNRSYLDFFIKGLFQRAQSDGTLLGIIEMDIDHFKQINDSYGHMAGDEALKLISSGLLSLCRQTETVFRMGGDEFLVVFHDLSEKSSFDMILQRISEGLPSTLNYHGHVIPLSVSMGFALYPENGENFDVLFKHADQQMYANKKSKETLGK